MMTAVIVLLPMTGFISSSISADGLLIAVGSLCAVYGLEVCAGARGPTALFVTIVAAGLIKPGSFSRPR
jgi:hypothetical protein